MHKTKLLKQGTHFKGKDVKNKTRQKARIIKKKNNSYQ